MDRSTVHKLTSSSQSLSFHNHQHNILCKSFKAALTRYRRHSPFSSVAEPSFTTLSFTTSGAFTPFP